MREKGTLWLIPTPLFEEGIDTIPLGTVTQTQLLKHFIVEHPKTARFWLKAMQHPLPMSELLLHELNEHTPATQVKQLIKPLLEGVHVGLMSEAGCPGVADPGAAVVRLCHQQGIEVHPLPGPSSILLALMASGMNGQQFTFHGYLQAKKEELPKDLKRLEQLAVRGGTQLFIEVPYRNNAMLETAIRHLAPTTLLGLACDLGAPTQTILMRPVSVWKSKPRPDLHKRPTVFFIGL